MKYVELEWRTKDGLRVFGCSWQEADHCAVRAVIGIVHGMGEHSGRYEEAAKAFTEQGYAVLALDQRGHGRSEGKRGHTPSYEALLEGVDLLYKKAHEQYPGVPCFLYGHSMGGNVILNYLIRRRPAVSGAIVTGPWLKLAFSPSAKDLFLARIMERLYPAYTSHRPRVVQRLTRDQEIMKKITDDPLGHTSITARFFISLHRSGLYALDHASDIEVPVLLLHGGEDMVTSLAASKEFAERMGERCTFRQLAGFRHELHNELDREQVFRMMLEWLENALPRR
jgi:alpha-beta hydrolase superfamily lysophospholipase